MTGVRRGVAVWVAVGLVVGAGLARAGPPEAVRVRVPAARTSAWFPAGTELTGLSSARFDELLRDARTGAARRASAAGPRLLRARHVARWDAGLLEGHSELTVAPPASGPAELVVDPWTPAVVGTRPAAPPLKFRDDGRPVVQTAPGGAPATLRIDWQLRARAGSRGWRFQLGLPATEVSELTLDLPEGWQPEGPAGLRSGPVPAPGPGKGRSLWSYLGPGGVLELRVVPPEARGSGPEGTGLWCSGPTRVDVDDAAATCTFEWSVGAAPWAPRTLAVDLDPGLDLIDVTGPGVEGYLAEPGAAGATRVNVRLKAPASGAVAAAVAEPTGVVIRALGAVPAEGRWTVPSARPANAVWTGGTTSVRLGGSRVVAGVKPLAGRRTVARGAGQGEERWLAFDAERPGAVAELDLKPPQADASAEVRGQLEIGSGPPRLDCRIAWQIHRGRLHALDFDLPRAWAAERVEVVGVDGPVTWHPDVLPDGGVRVRVPFPTAAGLEGRVVLRVEATSDVAGGRGPLSLPRVRPVGARVSDEVWVALTEPGISLQPKEVRGLAWIDPDPQADPPSVAGVGAAAVAGVTAAAPATEPARSLVRPALAWRWQAEDADARVEREHADPGTGVSVETTAVVSDGRLDVRARLEVTASDQPVRSLALGLTGPDTPAAGRGWRFYEEASGLELARKPLDAAARASQGLAGSGPAWLVEFTGPQRGKTVLAARYEGAWPGDGPLPLIVLPGSLRWRGVLLVLAGRNVVTSLDTGATRTLDPEVVYESLTRDEPPPQATDPARGGDRADLRRAHALSYDTASARVELRLGRLTPAAGEGVVRDAVLTSTVAPGQPERHHLVLRVLPDRSASISFTLPRGATLERVQRDGLPAVPSRSGAGLTVPLNADGAPAPARGLVTVSLDYLGPVTPAAGVVRVEPARPGLSLPCLGVAWELVVPEAWRVEEWGPELTPTDTDDAGRSGATLNDWRAPWRMFRRWRARRPGGATAGSPPALKALDDVLAAPRTEEPALGEWFVRWDATGNPLVVDRGALARAGWGPRSPVPPPRSKTGAPGTASAWLESLGLAVCPVGRLILITTRAEADSLAGERYREVGAAAAAARDVALAEAAAWGADRSGRYQSAARWREEPTPRAASTGDTESLPAAGRRVVRYVASGWPGRGTSVTFVDTHTTNAWGLVAGTAVLTLGLSLSRSRRSVRVGVGVALLGVGAVACCAAPLRYEAAARGLLAGAVGVACFGLGGVLRRGQPASSPEVRTSTYRPAPVRSNLVAPAGAVLAVVTLSAPWVLGQVAVEAPVVVLEPYEGVADPARPADRVLLRLTDYERLRALAEPAATTGPPTLRSLGTTHSVSWRDRDAVVVASEVLLESPQGDAGPLDWSFPAQDARDISAQLDGVDVPVRIDGGGKRAVVRVDPPRDAGRPAVVRRLVVRRFMVVVGGDNGLRAALSINPTATARVEVGPHPDGRRPVVVGARGRVDASPSTGGVSGLLGPVDRLEVLWTDPAAPAAPPRPTGSVEALALWDVTPAGDRVRARFTYRGVGGTEVVRIGLDPGVLLREATVPAGTDVSWEGVPGRPEWVARFDPPLPDGGTVGIDLWRPAGTTSSAPAETPRHTMPRVEPVGVERFAGSVAFRRPPDWVGRLEPVEGGEALSEEAFVRAWKGFPDEPLTLSGAVKLAALPAAGALPTVVSGPPVSRWRVKSDLRVDISPGRIGLTDGVTLTGAEGPVYETEVECPRGFRPVGVAADGLTYWEFTPERGLRLRFDGAAAQERKAVIRGWVPGPTDAAASREIEMPWLRWPGQQEGPVALSVSAPTRVVLVGGDEPVAASTPTGPTGPGPFRVTRSVRPGEPLRLRWDVEPPRVAVLVESQLTLDPESAEWEAVARYDVWGGPLDAIFLRAPSVWAGAMRVELAGVPFLKTAETSGEFTLLTLRPEHPVWGSQRVVVRASRALGPGEAVALPELAPRGLGAVDTYLRIVNATRQTLAIEGSPGLQPVAPGSVPADGELAASVPRAATSNSYHVNRPGWSLRVSRPGAAAGGTAAPGRFRPVTARMTCTLAQDGTLFGLARFEVSERPKAFLELAMGDEARGLWASLNGNPAVALRTAGGRLQVPLADRGPSRVALLWRTDPPPAGAREPRPLAFPLVVGEETAAVVACYVPDDAAVRSRSPQLRSVGLERALTDDADWCAAQAVESLDGFDRGARQSGEDLVASLVRFELRLRQAARAAAWDPTEPAAAREVRVTTSEQAARRLRAELTDALHNAGLDEYEASARVYLGMPADTSQPFTAPSQEPAQAPRPPTTGRPITFAGTLEAAVPAPLEFLTTAGPPAGPSVWPWLGFCAALLAAAATTFLPSRLVESRRARGTALGTVLAASAVALGPAALAAGLGLAALGRRAAVSPPAR